MPSDYAGGAFDAASFVTSGLAPAGAGGIRPNGAATTYAIAGLARSGATRSGYWPNSWADRVIVDVEGVNMVGKVWKGTIQITDRLYNIADVASFRTFDWKPEVEQDIIVAAGTMGRRYFGGTVVNVADDDMTEPGRRLYLVTCVDFTRKLGRRQVLGYWSGVAIDIAIREIVAQYAPGFSTAGVQANGPSISDMGFGGETDVAGAIDRVVNQPGWAWYVDAYGVVQAFDKRARMATPLLVASPGSIYYHFDKLRTTTAAEQLKTRINVKAGGGSTLDSLPAGTTAIPLDSVEWYPPAPFKVFGEYFVYNVNAVNVGTKTITIDAPGAPKTIPQGTKFNLWITRDNLEAQAWLRSIDRQSDGIIEGTISDERRNLEGAIVLADANLGMLGMPAISGSYETWKGTAHSGETVPVHLPYAKLWQDFQVQEVITTLVAAPYYIHKRVTFSDTRLITFRDILRARERSRKDR